MATRQTNKASTSTATNGNRGFGDPDVTDPNDPAYWGFKGYAPTIYVMPGDRIKGRFKKVALGPVTDYGRPPVVTFEAIAGTAHTGPGADDSVFDLEPGKEYSLWLLSTVSRRGFAEGEPVEDEVFTYINHGRRVSKDGREYIDCEVGFPERPAAVQEVLSWADLMNEDAPGDRA